jgi:large subunit ribosomal protein L5
MAARLRELYHTKVAPALSKEFGYPNHMAVPKIEKISINIGLGEATQNAKLMDGAVNELGQIAGQKPIITKATKSIAQFKLREGQSIGCMVTLRGDRMYEFLRRLLEVVRRTCKLHAGYQGSVDFSRDRLRQGGEDQGHEHFDHHHGAD